MKPSSNIVAVILVNCYLSTPHIHSSRGGGGGRYIFLPLNDQQSGILLGVPSIVLFFLSFGFASRPDTVISHIEIVHALIDYNIFTVEI